MVITDHRNSGSTPLMTAVFQTHEANTLITSDVALWSILRPWTLPYFQCAAISFVTMSKITVGMSILYDTIRYRTTEHKGCICM